MIQDIEDSSDDEELGAIHTSVVNSITSLSSSLPQAIKVRKKIYVLWIFFKVNKYYEATWYFMCYLSLPPSLPLSPHLPLSLSLSQNPNISIEHVDTEQAPTGSLTLKMVASSSLSFDRAESVSPVPESSGGSAGGSPIPSPFHMYA